MKVCFLYPPHQMVNKYYYTPRIWRHYSHKIRLPHLGISYLAALLRQQGIDATVIDANALDWDLAQILRQINQIQPEYLLYTSITDTFQDTLHWIRQIKAAYNVPVIIGGPHVEIYPKETLTHDVIDYGVVGDGWETLPELLDALTHHQELSTIRGLCFRQYDKIIMTPQRKKWIGLEDVPFPARELLPNEQYDIVLSQARPITTMLMALGCPFQCHYCCTDRYVRPRSVEHLVAEVEECVKKHGIREIEFYDETFTVNQEKVFQFLARLKERDLQFRWSIRTRCDCVTQNLIQKMADGGCIRISYGIESGDPLTLERLGRKISPEIIKKAVQWTKQANIMTCGFFMIGLPQETKTQIETTLYLMKELDLDFIQLNKFIPKPNTPIYAEISRVTGYDFWKEYTLGNVGLDDFAPTYLTMTIDELNNYLEKGYWAFYYRPSYIWRRMRKVNSFSQFYRMASAAISFRRSLPGEKIE